MSYIIEKSIKKIMSQILKVDIKLINQQSSASAFDNWDSMSNVRLILAIEKKFDIKIQISETTSIDNVGDLIRLVLSKTN